MDSFINLDMTFNTRYLDIKFNHNKNNLVIKNLYRSDKLNNLTDLDIQKIRLLKIERIIDFRSVNEKHKYPNKIIEGIEYIHLPIDIDNYLNDHFKLITTNNSNENLEIIMKKAYYILPIKYKNIYEKFIKILINKPMITLYHCSSGKDRTGFATVLILSILGIKKNIIYNNYLLSNRYIKNGKNIWNNDLTILAKQYNLDENKSRVYILCKNHFRK